MSTLLKHRTDSPPLHSHSLIASPIRLQPHINIPAIALKKAVIESKSSSNLKKEQKLRIAFYSHDTMGLGHKRRNLLIAQTLGVSTLNADILMISGMNDLTQGGLHDNIEYITLPALNKTLEGEYQAKRWEMSLKEIINLRSQEILATIKNFQPDVLIVDNVPRGAMGELNDTLKYLRNQGKTLSILGLRDILDEPDIVQQQWKKVKNEKAIRRYYDAVWVYGDPVVYNLLEEYNFAPDIATKFRYTGYLDQRLRQEYSHHQEQYQLNETYEKLALCLVGGGQDGANLAQTFAQAKLPVNTQGIIVTGPLMPQHQRQQLQNYAENRPNLQVLEYVIEPTLLLQKADVVVAMGGYNTTCEILSFEKPSLIVPRIKPRQEQLIRAQRLQQLGLVDMLHPNQVTPEALTQWLSQEITKPQVHQKVDFQGLQRIPYFLAEMLTKIH